MGDTFVIREEKNILQYYRQPKVRNQAISNLASDLYFVRDSEMIQVLADNLRKSTDVQAVGVVDDHGRVVGMIVKDDFFNTMVRPYARDVFKNRPVREVMTRARTFDSDINLFTVAEDINQEMKSHGIHYFILTNREQEFRGIFSTQDVLVYLSQMTQNDIALARKLQSRIVRERELQVGESFEFIASSHKAKGVGGDFYDIRKYSDTNWVLAFCDVSGKGVSASIITSVIWGMMSIFDFTQGLATFVRRLNEYIVRTFESEKFVTGVFLDYNERSGELEVFDMGHSHLFLFRKGRLIRLKNSRNNLPIGVMPDLDPGFDTIRPWKNDTLFLLTDGMIEQDNNAGEVYSMDRIGRILRENISLPVELTGDALLSDFNTFRGQHHLNDDVTFALMRFAHQEVTL
ncbi:MAG: SpoIIE family protein phosphatase [Spirochaetes bacterium]|jgi:sigma-B regulation protein RsbU (phosphoserine phosphatase)|nr:SpoIIE family protein phosphatase [Spirochaetota bacterium]